MATSVVVSGNKVNGVYSYCIVSLEKLSSVFFSGIKIGFEILYLDVGRNC